MNKAITFIQPMSFTGIPNTSSWAGYDFLQWTGDTFHPGLDYNYGAGEADKGKPVLCIGNGFIEKAIGWDGVTKGFGNHVFVKHILEDDTVIYSHYCHLDSTSCTEGQDIEKGQEIGKCGGSGGWPSHLHLEVRKPLDKGWEFWPKGMSEAWIASNYFDPYGFIEKRKDIQAQSPELVECLKQHQTLVNSASEKDKLTAELENELESKNSQVQGYQDNLKAIASNLSSSDNQVLLDVVSIQGAIVKLKEEEDQLRQTFKTNETLKKDNENMALELQKIKENIGLELDKIAATSVSAQLGLKDCQSVLQTTTDHAREWQGKYEQCAGQLKFKPLLTILGTYFICVKEGDKNGS